MNLSRLLDRAIGRLRIRGLQEFNAKNLVQEVHSWVVLHRRRCRMRRFDLLAKNRGVITRRSNGKRHLECVAIWESPVIWEGYLDDGGAVVWEEEPLETLLDYLT